jgi:putative GTP pyrophosphokinase
MTKEKEIKFKITQIVKDFLKRNLLSEADWQASGCRWELFDAIKNDYEIHIEELNKTAEFCAGMMQKINRVHSVRWRIKSADHILKKIVRKKIEGKEKYKDISVENYHEKITDLIGVRALHLFKNDCFEIDAAIRDLWRSPETPIAYLRKGDDEDMRQRFSDHGFEIQDHQSGYRSVHYIFETTPLKRKVSFEVQVRTIFEEGWSEIDHQVRYPNFSNHPQINLFLGIFNRLAGSADEMGSFVRVLAESLAKILAEAASKQSTPLPSSS